MNADDEEINTNDLTGCRKARKISNLVIPAEAGRGGVRAAERVQRVWLHPGQQQHITDFCLFNIWTPAFAGVTMCF
jgi:hypothetical protein